MDASSLALRIYRSADPSSAFGSLIEGVAEWFPVRAAIYLEGNDQRIRDRWPTDVEVSADLLDAAAHVPHTEVFPLGSEFPFDSEHFANADLLILPLHRTTPREASCLLISPAGAFGEDLQPWMEVAEALQDFEDRHVRIAHAESECAELRRRVEESESLHTLGLAVNRTLNKEEVLGLVARFARTLLGAHYVTVNTVGVGHLPAIASIGLRNPAAAAEEQHLARCVVEAEKPLVIGGESANLQVEAFPFHAGEGMRAGLGIPLSLFGETFGALIAGFRREYSVSARDIRLGLTLAGHAAVAISNARLHAAVEERSRQLAAAYDELDSISRAKERFFAFINHELRNPVNAVLGYHTLVLEEGDDTLGPRPRDWIRKAHRNAATLRTLVDDVLELSKLAAGRLDLELQRCTVAGIVDAVMGTIQPLADARGVPISVNVPATLPPLVTDPGRVQQVLVNLLSNAVKFTGDGGVELIAAPAERSLGESAADFIELRVVDRGAGIEEADCARIFEEYEQVKGTRGGTGLGLPISRRLARALGGDLAVESQVGAGSTFRLTLPLSSPSD